MTVSCEWAEADPDEEGGWHTECGGFFVLNEGTPEENRMRYCCYCGKPLMETPFVDPDFEY